MWADYNRDNPISNTDCFQDSDCVYAAAQNMHPLMVLRYRFPIDFTHVGLVTKLSIGYWVQRYICAFPWMFEAHNKNTKSLIFRFLMNGRLKYWYQSVTRCTKDTKPPPYISVEYNTTLNKIQKEDGFNFVQAMNSEKHVHMFIYIYIYTGELSNIKCGLSITLSKRIRNINLV